MINRSFKDFKNIHKKKINQVIYSSLNAKNENFLINLINNFFNVKNSFVFESVEKGKIRGRYTIFGKDPDKIWEFNNNQAYFINSTKRKKIKGSPKKIIEKIIENYKFETDDFYKNFKIQLEKFDRHTINYNFIKKWLLYKQKNIK